MNQAAAKAALPQQCSSAAVQQYSGKQQGFVIHVDGLGPKLQKGDNQLNIIIYNQLLMIFI
jgi:hypothetical protein